MIACARGQTRRKLNVGERWMFLVLALVLLLLGSYATLNPRAVKRENADGPYFKTGFARMPLWFFRTIGFVTLGVAVFFGYMVWTH